MKRILCILSVLALCVASLISCSSNDDKKVYPNHFNKGFESVVNTHEGESETPEQTMIELGLGEYFANNLSDNQYLSYAKSKSITVASSKANDENDPLLYMTFCDIGDGKFLFSVDVEWQSLPKKGAELLGVSSLFDKTMHYGSIFMWVAYGDFDKRELTIDKDFTVYSREYGTAVSARYDLDKILSGVKTKDGYKLRIHFEFICTKMHLGENFTTFGMSVLYDHGEDPYDGKTDIGIKASCWEFFINNSSDMSATKYGMYTSFIYRYIPKSK